jgi:nicotinate phosphoribosyltransferase
MLDDADLKEVKIVASNSLDEFIIKDLIEQGAMVDSFGVGERLVTSKSEPVFGGVYKLVAVEEDGELSPRIKLSENATKVTTPAFKEVYRLFDNATGKAIADVLTLKDETIDDTKPYTIFHPVQTYKKKTLTNFTAKKLLVPVFVKGECVYQSPNVDEIKRYCAEQLELIWDEVKRFENPHEYYVDLSKPLWDVKQTLLNQYFQ